MASRRGLSRAKNAGAKLEALRRVIARLASMEAELFAVATVAIAASGVGEAQLLHAIAQ